MKRFYLLYTALILAASFVAGSPAAAENAPQNVPSDARAIIARMVSRNPSLDSYRSRVHVNVRMLNFPFLAPKLDGTSYFKRPNLNEVVFDRVPSYAKGFSRLFNDVADPGQWEKDQNIAYDGTQNVDGRTMIVLRLTKKIHSDILDHTLAFVDPQTYALEQMEWDYTSGGKITMVQNYRSEMGFTVLSTQHATIDIPHVHAVADASYGAYQTNVNVDVSPAP
jgi:outer membrane lipoprotein-sorting protein